MRQVGFEPTTSPLSGACLAATGYKSAALPIELQARESSMAYEERMHCVKCARGRRDVQGKTLAIHATGRRRYRIECRLFSRRARDRSRQLQLPVSVQFRLRP